MGTWFVCAECGCSWEGEVKCPSDKPHPHNLVYGPKLTVDAIIEYRGRIVLIQRAKRDGTPTGEWALPGGYVNFRERLVDAVVRETKEETGLDIIRVRLFGIYDDPERDRAYGRNNVSVVYTALACGEFKLPEKEVAAIRGFTLEEIKARQLSSSLPENVAVAGESFNTKYLREGKLTLAFDHGMIFNDYLRSPEGYALRGLLV